MKYCLLITLLLLSACGAEQKAVSARQVSRVEPAAASGLTYREFRIHEFNEGSDMKDVQKRFLSLDRDNNGLLTPNEFSGF